MKLSLCIATFNEEKNIHYPLNSALDIVDEVIIVDGGSTDKTVEIAKSYGKKIRIINTDNPVMFHKNKQKAIEAAKGEWVLQLDADEELTPELRQEIRGIIKSGSSIVAYNIPRKNWFLTRFLMKGGQYPDYTIRLYRNGVAKFPDVFYAKIDSPELIKLHKKLCRIGLPSINKKFEDENYIPHASLVALSKPYDEAININKIFGKFIVKEIRLVVWDISDGQHNPKVFHRFNLQ